MSVIEIHKLPNNRSTGAAAQLLCRSDLTGGRPVNSMLGNIPDLSGSDMKRSLFITLILLVTLPVRGQTNDCEVDLKINGIGIASSYATVLRKLGKPLDQKKEKALADHSCSGETETVITLKYPGLQIVCLGDANGKQVMVTSIEITSSKWLVRPDIKLGATRQEIRTRLGKQGQSEKDALFYCTKENLGTVKFTFAKNKLVKILMAETLC